MPSVTRSGQIAPVEKSSIKRRRSRKCAKLTTKNIQRVYATEKSSGRSGRIVGKQRSKTVQKQESCDRFGCKQNQRCCLKIVSNCLESTTELNFRLWTHVTPNEHYCVECRDAFLKPDGYLHAKYIDWRQRWLANSRRDPTPRIFAVDALLPWYLQCSVCSKWRQYLATGSLDPDFIRQFTCSQSVEHSSQILQDELQACQVAEHDDVKNLLEMSAVERKKWFGSLMTPMLMQHSPTLLFLLEYYFNDEIGLSPVFGNKVIDSRDMNLDNISLPFYLPGETITAMCIRPDIMEYDEIVLFPEHTNEPSVYLGLRNLLIAMWHIRPTEWLIVNKAFNRILCRGMLRVMLQNFLVDVYDTLAIRSLINTGIIKNPTICHTPNTPVFNSKRRNVKKSDDPLPVVIIGAGIAGCAAASQLKRHGQHVIILEATDRVGGRMKDDYSLGVAVGTGAQLVTGIINNPITMMCYQTDVKYHCVKEDCPLIDANTGQLVDALADKRVDFHFNCILDAISEWRDECTVKQPSNLKNISLHDSMLSMHRQFLLGADGATKWNLDEERCLQWQLGNVEFSCGARLDQVSAAYWDQNENFAQFGGYHALLTEGSNIFLEKLIEDVDIRLKCEVQNVDYRDKDRIVINYIQNGETHQIEAQKALVTVSLAVLKSDLIQFQPPLPKSKLQAIGMLGAGCIEKVAVKFPRRFWAKKCGDADYFGHVPVSSETRALFNMFYDLSSNRDSLDDPDASYVLMSYVCAQSIDLVNEKTDKEVVDKFIEVLQTMFVDEIIPDPIGSVVTHWRNDKHFGMAYSYVGTGATGDSYDRLAEDVEQCLYFAGEATNRFYPQTMTGACLSGYREAAKILSLLRAKPKI